MRSNIISLWGAREHPFGTGGTEAVPRPQVLNVRILFIPLDTFGRASNEYIPGRIRLLLARNELLGVPRSAPFTRGLAGAVACFRFAVYVVRTFLYGLFNRHRFNVIFCNESFYTLIGGTLSLLLKKPCVRDCAGVPSEWISRIKPPRWHAACVLLANRVAAKLSTMSIVLSEEDKRAHVAAGINNEAIDIVPLTVDFSLIDAVDKAQVRLSVRQSLHLPPESPLVVFTGSSREYPPNWLATRWIVEELAPALGSRIPGARILVTGTGPVPGNHPNVVYTGFVENLFEYISAADVAIVPQDMKSGMSTKALDAMACGVPVVAMASIANGIPQLQDGYSALMALDDNEFIGKTVFLLEHREQATGIGIVGRKIAREFYDQRLWEDRMLGILRRLNARLDVITKHPGSWGEEV